MQIGVTIEGAAGLKYALSEHARQIPYATSLALNWTANGVRLAGAADLRAKLDKPVPAVRSGLLVVNSSKTNLAAEVRVKIPGDTGWPDRSLAEIIGQQFAGGSRQQKTIERALTKAGLIRAGEFIVPGPAATLDAFGNIARAQLKQIYAALGTLADGKSAAPSLRGRKKEPAQRLFWALGSGRTGHLSRGLWAVGERRLQPILLVISSVRYTPRIGLHGIAAGVVSRDFPGNFQRAWNKAIRTAK